MTACRRLLAGLPPLLAAEGWRARFGQSLRQGPEGEQNGNGPVPFADARLQKQTDCSRTSSEADYCRPSPTTLAPNRVANVLPSPNLTQTRGQRPEAGRRIVDRLPADVRDAGRRPQPSDFDRPAISSSTKGREVQPARLHELCQRPLLCRPVERKELHFVLDYLLGATAVDSKTLRNNNTP
ncbi:hypothetical protein LX36DRAFT_672639 [Colletotrichum falcatum]|nr:hypothetical protein LX36DRAFT_672639 [Colletotrichum falcatum]